MFSKNDIKTIEHLLTLIDKLDTDDIMEGNISNNRKVTVYKLININAISMYIKGEVK